jgi:hypothetical protein
MLYLSILVHCGKFGSNSRKICTYFLTGILIFCEDIIILWLIPPGVVFDHPNLRLSRQSKDRKLYYNGSTQALNYRD